MPVDRSAVGEVAATVMGELEERFGEQEDAHVRAVLLVVPVDHVEENEQGVPEGHTEVRWGASDGLPRHEAIGLLEYVKPYFWGTQ
jgi:hypothetical protein